MNVLVVGSINIDEVSYVKKFPKIGETIIVKDSNSFHGGKGANQAIAIKRLNNKGDIHVSMFAKVGENEMGIKEINHLKKNKINVDYISFSNKNTGKATIIVSYLEGDNKIIIDKGANSDFSKEDSHSLENAIKKNEVIVIQLEVNDWLIENCLKIAKKHNKIIVMNPAPANNFNSKWLKYIDWLIPNETELEFIANVKINNINEIELVVNDLRKQGLKNALVTLGESGAYISTNRIKKWLPTKKVSVVDTTAAGDTFIGSFVANALNEHDDEKFIMAVKNSMYAAALTIQKKGAQRSIPTFKEMIKWKTEN